jgi:hypothetical protein
MDLRNERGAISGAEGCMFFAMFLFAVLLIGLLVVAFFRFQEPPQNLPVGGPPPTGLIAPVPGHPSPVGTRLPDWRLATGNRLLAELAHG